MERNIYDVNREPYTFSDRGARHDFAEPFGQLRAAGFFSDLTKKLVSSAGEKAASAIGAKAGEAFGNKLFNRKKKKAAKAEASDSAAPSASPKTAGPSALAVEENKGNELVKLLQAENEKLLRVNNIHEIYKRLLSDE